METPCQINEVIEAVVVITYQRLGLPSVFLIERRNVSYDTIREKVPYRLNRTTESSPMCLKVFARGIFVFLLPVFVA